MEVLQFPGRRLAPPRMAAWVWRQPSSQTEPVPVLRLPWNANRIHHEGPSESFVLFSWHSPSKGTIALGLALGPRGNSCEEGTSPL